MVSVRKTANNTAIKSATWNLNARDARKMLLTARKESRAPLNMHAARVRLRHCFACFEGVVKDPGATKEEVGQNY